MRVLVAHAESDVTAFLTDLAIRGKVSASTQNQALSALRLLYRNVLGRELDWSRTSGGRRALHRCPSGGRRGAAYSDTLFRPR